MTARESCDSRKRREEHAERVLLVGGGDLGMRVAARLLRANEEHGGPAGSAALATPGTQAASVTSAAPAPVTSAAPAPVTSATRAPVTPAAPAPATSITLWALRRRPPATAGPIRWLAGDVGRPGTLSGLPRGITRLIYVLAPDARDPAAYRTVYTDGPRHLLAALDTSALRRMVFVSSSAVYGDHGGGWVDEDTPPAPQGSNGEILLRAEQWLAAQGLPVTALRLAGLYGPGRVQLLDRLRQGRAHVPRAVPHWANRMHADDAAAAIAHLARLADAAPVYLGADDTPLPLDVLYDHLARLLGAPLPPAGPPPAGVGSKRLRNARLRAAGLRLGWPDARDGYARLIETA